MQNTFSFAWRCSYRRSVFFDCYAHGERFEVELLTAYDDSDAATYNGGPDAYRRQVGPRVGYLTRGGIADLTPEFVAAFNTWRRSEWERQIAQMRAAPERYGDIPADPAALEADPLLRPPSLALGAANYRDGYAWELLAVAS